MKTKFTLLVCILLLSLHVNAQLMKDTAMQQKKYSVGLGYARGTSGRGASAEFHFFKQRKSSYGFKAILTNNPHYSYKQQYLDGFGNLMESVTVVDPTIAIDVSIFSSYYIFGTNSTKRAGLFLSNGLSYFHQSESSSYENYSVSGSKYSSFDSETLNNTLGFYGSLGFDLKIWKGRLFLEFPFTIGLWGTYSYRVSNEVGYNDHLPSFSERRNILDGIFGTGPLGGAYQNLGYKIIF